MALLPRKRLFRQLDKLQAQATVWITGPPGAGKTSLATGYLKENKRPHIWYQIDAGDADPATFFYYLGLAAQKAKPGRKKPLPLLTPEYLQDIPTFTRRYFEQFYSRLTPGTFVVFDNYQELSPDALLHQVIHDGLAVLPEQVRVLIMSRRMPPALFARQRAHEKLVVLSWEDIRLRLEETGAIVRARAGKSFSRRVVAELHRAVAGWPAGLTMLIEQLKAKGTNATDMALRPAEEVFNYFANEVFDRAESSLQQLLLKCAFLPKVTVRNAQALTGLEKAGTLLDNLSKAGYFTTPHVGPEKMYEFHPLFRAFLMDRAKGHFKAEKYHSLLIQAAGLLEVSGQVEAAVQLLQQAEAWETLTGTILKQSKNMLEQSRGRTLEAWIRSLPVEQIDCNGWLCYWLGLCLLPADVVASRRSLGRAFELFQAGGDTAGVYIAWIAVVNNYFMEFNDFKPLDRWIDWLDNQAKQGLSFPSLEIEASVAESMACALVWRRPYHPHTAQWVERALSLLKYIYNSNPFYYAYYLYMGRFNDYAMIMNEMKNNILARTPTPLMIISMKILEVALYETYVSSSRKALDLLAECLDLARENGLHMVEPLIFIHGVYNTLNLSDMKKTREFLGHIEQTLGSSRSNHSGHYYYLVAWYYLAVGNAAQAVVSATKALDLVTQSGTLFPETSTQILLAIALHEAGDFEQANRYLAAPQEVAQKTGSFYYRFILHLISAYFCFKEHKEQAGLEALRTAMQLGRQHDYATMVNLWLPKVMSALCAKALEAGIETEYAQKLIRGLNLVPDSRAAQIETWPWEIRIKTLGRFEILRDGRPIEFSVKAPRKILLLLKALIACGRHGAGEEQMADLLWPEADGDIAQQTLATSLHRLRQLLGHERAIQVRAGQIRFDSQVCWIDAHAFENLATQSEEVLKGNKSQENLETGLHFLERTLTIYQGSFLQGATEAWAVSYRERLRAKFIRTLEWLGEHWERAGRLSEAMALYERGLEVDALAEDLYRRIMRCCLIAGRQAEAVQVYERCRTILGNSLGVTPSPETEALLKNAKKPL